MLGCLDAPVREVKAFCVFPRGYRWRGGRVYFIIDKSTNIVHHIVDVAGEDVRARLRVAGPDMGPLTRRAPA